MASASTRVRSSGVHQSQLLRAYQPLRVWLGCSGVFVFAAAAIASGWWEGYVAAGAMATQAIHGLHRLRNPSDDPWSVLFVDISVIGIGSLLIRSLAVVGLAFGLLVAVVAALTVPASRLRSWVYAAAWFVVVLVAHELLGRTSLSSGTISLINLSAVIVFIPAIAILVSSATSLVSNIATSRDEFLASVSHEIRTPLTMVVGLAHELAEDPHRFSPDERAEFIGMISDQSSELSHIVDDLLVAARLDGGELSVSPIDLDLCSLVETAVADCEPVISPYGAIVQVFQPESVRAWADPTRVRQIIRNLLTNALRYGGPSIEVGCVAGPNGMSFVEVRDNGEGVPEAARERIFRPYERAHSLRGQPGSVGLGLAVSTQLADLMRGELTYRYEDGWSLFRLALPTSVLSPNT